MKVLVACEFSGVVRDAFIRAGHDAWSCDLLPCENDGPHMQGDVRNVLSDLWDLLVAFPPCTHLCVSGARWFAKKRAEQAESLAFVRLLMGCAGCPNRHREPHRCNFNGHSQAGSNPPAVAIWAWRGQGHMPLAARSAQAKAHEHREWPCCEGSQGFPRPGQGGRNGQGL